MILRWGEWQSVQTWNPTGSTRSPCPQLFSNTSRFRQVHWYFKPWKGTVCCGAAKSRVLFMLYTRVALWSTDVRLLTRFKKKKGYIRAYNPSEKIAKTVRKAANRWTWPQARALVTLEVVRRLELNARYTTLVRLTTDWANITPNALITSPSRRKS